MELTTKLLNYITQGSGDFNVLALAVFEYQYHHCLPYQRYCQQLQRTPPQVKHWHDIPPVATEVFREVALCTFPRESAQFIFQTSGTTQGAKGQHYYRDMQLYDAAIAGNFMPGLGLDPKSRVTLRLLSPSFADMPQSSLCYMLERALAWYGDDASRFYVNDQQLDYEALAQDLTQDVAKGRQVVLIGTAFAWINFFDEVPGCWRLPQGSVLMETGGLKGRARSVTRSELYQLFTSRLGLALNHCFSEYGMTELSSQCYSKPNSHIFKAPAWLKIRIINPETQQEVALGDTGIVQLFDLANLEAISAITTSDLAIRYPDGFKLLGRAPLALLRGCSMTFET